MPQLPPLVISAFEGMNRAVPYHLAKDSELDLCINANAALIGAKTKRPPYATYLDNPDSSKVQALYFWLKADGTKMLFRVSNGVIYRQTIGTDATWQSVETGLTDTRTGIATLNGKTFFSTGEDPMIYTADGAAFVEVTAGTPPRPKFLTVFQGRLQGAASSTEVSTQDSLTGPSSIYFSRVNDGTDWNIDLNDPSAAGFAYIDPDSNGRINGFHKALNREMIFKQSALYRYDGTTVSDLNLITTTSGYSVASLKDFLIFLNQDGVWGYSGTTPDIISVAIKDIIASLDGDELVDASAAVYKREWFCSVGAVTIDGIVIDNCVLHLDFDNAMWHIYSFAHKPTAWVTFRDADNNEQLLFGDEDGQCYLWDSGDDGDAGTPIEMLVRTHNYDDSLPENPKQYDSCYIEAEPSAGLIAQFSVDDGNWYELGEVNEPITKFTFPKGVTGAWHKRIKFSFVHNETVGRPVIKRIKVYRSINEQPF